MAGYQGTIVLTDLTYTPFNGYTASDWTLEWLDMYGQIDGADHKQWVIDQIARINTDTPVIVELASWQNGTQEYRLSLAEPTAEYHAWVSTRRECDDYDYDVGIAP
jgi:hypothetical protein